jgi:hypothetical protein
MAKYNYDCEAFGKAFFKRDPECQKCDEQNRCELKTKARLKNARKKLKEDEKGGKKKKVKQTLATYGDSARVKDKAVKPEKDKKKTTSSKKKKVTKKTKFSFGDEVKSSIVKKGKKKKKFKLS